MKELKQFIGATITNLRFGHSDGFGTEDCLIIDTDNGSFYLDSLPPQRLQIGICINLEGDRYKATPLEYNEDDSNDREFIERPYYSDEE